MKALKMEKRETFYMTLSLPTQKYRRSPLVTLRHHEQENKRVINLFLVSLSLSARPPCSLGVIKKLLSLTLSITHIPLSLFFVRGC